MFGTKPSAEVRGRVGAICLMLPLVLLLIIPLFGPAWHALRGDSISYQGWRIPVPDGFFVRNERATPTMWKLTLGTPLWRAPFGQITVFTYPSDRPFRSEADYNNFARGVIHAARSDGYSFLSTRKVASGHAAAYCWEFASSKRKAESAVRCAVGDSLLVLFYSGHQKYLPQFYSALQGVSREKPSAGP